MRAGPPLDVTLLAPGLLGPGALGSGPSGAVDRGAVDALVAGLDIGALDRLLGRAELCRAGDGDDTFESLAFRAFGYPTRLAGTDWPVAAFTALIDLDPLEPGGARLRADPVHLRADIADLVLFDPGDAHVSVDEARALEETVNAALAPDGPFVDAAHPHRWYVALDAPARITTTPLSHAAGGQVSPAMPRGPDAPPWHRWMNEVQMALHDCPVNAARERYGAAPINSLWPWGGGSLPPAADTSLAQAWSEEVLVQGLALHAGIECRGLPEGAAEWLQGAPRPGTHLVVFDALHRAAHRADIDSWRDALERLSRLWAAPLLEALDRGDISAVSMHDARGNRFATVGRGRLRWRRRGGLAARIVQSLEQMRSLSSMRSNSTPRERRP